MGQVITFPIAPRFSVWIFADPGPTAETIMQWGVYVELERAQRVAAMLAEYGLTPMVFSDCGIS